MISFFTGSKYVNPLSIDPNERVTPSHPGSIGIGDHINGLVDNTIDDIPDLSIAVNEIGVIPPPPMFSSPSPPPPPPPPLTSNQVGNGHVIVNHQVFHTNITVDGHDLSGQEPPQYLMQGMNYFIINYAQFDQRVQSCSAGAKKFTNYVFCHPQFSGVIQNIDGGATL